MTTRVTCNTCVMTTRVMYYLCHTQAGLHGVDLASLTPQDWFYHAGTALYGSVNL